MSSVRRGTKRNLRRVAFVSITAINFNFMLKFNLFNFYLQGLSFNYLRTTRENIALIFHPVVNHVLQASQQDRYQCATYFYSRLDIMLCGIGNMVHLKLPSAFKNL